MNIIKSLSLLALSGILGVFIATAWVNYGAAELAALIYVVIPLCVVLISILLFFVFPHTVISKRNLMIILVSINILTGVLMRLDFYYHILGL
jgi:hypothetical protein